VRTLTALALALLACAPADRGDAPPGRDSQTPATPNGPDPIVLRVPRGGGPAVAYVYPALDSVVWESNARVPALGRVLSFDAEQGALAFVDAKGAPGRLDLRLGAVATTAKPVLTDVASADAEAIYGIGASGSVVRLTPSAEAWELRTPTPARAVIPQPDGWLLVLADRPDSGSGRGARKESVLWRLRPPEKQLLDTLVLPRAGRVIRTRVGDIVYLVADDELIGVRSRTLERMPAIEFDGPITALAPTPSGDRIFVATDSSDRLAVVDRYAEDVTSRVRLPGVARELRMDPLGRYLLVRPTSGDSAWVVAVSNGELVGMVRTEWRADLPFVAPDGALALLRGGDVTFADAATGQARARVAGGAADFWYTMSWNGFRPRSEELDDPVQFRVRAPRVDTTPPDTLPPADTTAAAPADTVTAPVRPPAPAGFTVSFAALLNQQSAIELAQAIEVDGQRARVTVGQRSGTPIYRVVLGPYSTRAEAERVGRASGRTHFVYEGNP
jgi:hypothetical protein